MNHTLSIQRVLGGLFLSALTVLIYGYFAGYELSIPWNVTTSAESEEVVVHQFQKGPFSFDFTGTVYELTENFSAGPIQNAHSTNSFFLILLFLGICMLLSVSTYLSRIWFIGIAGLFIFFIINLRLQDIGLFGLEERSPWGVIMLLAAYLIPTYLFHAFFNNVPFPLRLTSLIGITALIALVCQVPLTSFQSQLITGSYFGLVIVALLFLFIIAEENIFGILYLITRNRGGQSNHIHFSIFSLIYLGFLALYYGKKSGLLKMELTYFDPYLLFAISSLVAFWSLKFKKTVFENIISLKQIRLLFTGVGIITFGFLGLSFFRGNDPVYEGLHYFIIYCHLGFGVMFFFYLILNFINPLSKGLQVYKIAYKEQNFPYVSAKLAGIAAVVAFFLLSNKEPFLLFRAGHFNYLGVQAEEEGETLLAQEYYQEGSIYGHDNHFSNYKMGYHLLQKRDIDEASYRFHRASLRYPSPHSFINRSSTLAMEGEATPSLVTLKDGLRTFPGHKQLLNNLGLIYLDLGNEEEALQYLSQSTGGQGEWNQANKVNLWRIKDPGEKEALESDYHEGNLALKANILARLLQAENTANVSFDSTFLKSSYPLHRLVFLINSSWYFNQREVSALLDKNLTGSWDEVLLQAAKHAVSLNNYLDGRVNDALFSHDVLITESRKVYQKQYLHELGLMALEQHALPNALDFFEQAIDLNSERSQVSKIAVLTEMKRFDEAISWTSSLLKSDSSYFGLLKDLKAISNQPKSAGDDNDQLTRLYYRWDDYSIPEMSVLLDQADPAYASSLWNKVSFELLLQNELERLADYRDLFQTFLSDRHFTEVNTLISYQQGETAQNDHPFTMAMRLEDDSVRAEALYELAAQNALNVPMLLAGVNELNKVNEDLAYDVLVEAYNLNQFSPAIIKAYINQCLDMNLVDYATAPLDRLAELIPDDAYFDYVNRVNEKLNKIEQEKW